MPAPLFRKTTTPIALRPGTEGTHPGAADGFELVAFPVLVVTPMADGSRSYALTHRPTGYAVRSYLKFNEARALALSLGVYVRDVPAWSGTDPHALVAATPPAARDLLRYAPGRF
jgi:hypothetical protein